MITTLALITAINDAVSLSAALTPLVQQALALGQTEVSDEAVTAAQAKLGTNIDALDKLIADAKQGSLLG